MGASLGCCLSPSDDFDSALLKGSRYHPMMGPSDAVEKSLLSKLQRSLSTSWTTRGGAELRSPHSKSLVHGPDYESESDTEEPSGIDSNASATSGSRMLCDFYNLVLECDHSKFFVDASGRPVKGTYLYQIDILEDYFDLARRATVASRRRRRSSVDEKALLQYQPPHKLKHLSSYERSSNMSLMSTDTTQTFISESDYWATFMDAADETFGYDPPSLSRRGSSERRRSWVVHDMNLYSSDTNLLLFSPVNTAPTRQRSASRTCASPNERQPPAMPIEGNRYNLWGHDDKNMNVPTVFTSAAIAERRRASLTTGVGPSTRSHGASRRSSVHSIAPIAAS